MARPRRQPSWTRTTTRHDNEQSVVPLSHHTLEKVAKRVRAGRLQKRRRFLKGSLVAVECERKWVSTDGTAFVRTTDDNRLMMESLMNEFGPMPCDTSVLFRSANILDCKPLARTSLALVTVGDDFNKNVRELFLVDFRLSRFQLLSADYEQVQVTPNCEHVLVVSHDAVELYSLASDLALPVGDQSEIMTRTEIPVVFLPAAVAIEEEAKELIHIDDDKEECVLMNIVDDNNAHRRRLHLPMITRASTNPFVLEPNTTGRLVAIAYSIFAQASRLLVRLYHHRGGDDNDDDDRFYYKICYTQDQEDGEQTIAALPNVCHAPHLVCSAEYGFAAFCVSEYQVAVFFFYQRRLEIFNDDDDDEKRQKIDDLFIDTESGDLFVSMNQRRCVRIVRFGIEN